MDDAPVMPAQIKDCCAPAIAYVDLLAEHEVVLETLVANWNGRLRVLLAAGGVLEQSAAACSPSSRRCEQQLMCELAAVQPSVRQVHHLR